MAEKLTRTENLKRVLSGRRPQWRPCSINFNQWYGHHRTFSTLPPELAGTADYLDAMLAADLDIFSRNLDGGVRQVVDGVEPQSSEEAATLGPRYITQWVTPHGTLRQICEYQTSQSSSYNVEDLVKDWQSDGKAYRWLLDHTRYTWNRDTFLAHKRRIGDRGIFMVPVGQTPLKKLQIDLGLDHSCYFILDHPEEAQACAAVYWERLWPVLVQLAQDPEVDAASLMDNVDSPFYPPDLCATYWTPYVRQAAELYESHGKVLFVHACGRLDALKGVFRESKVHGLEGMAHAPLGDFRPRDAEAIHDRFIFNGGFTAQEQVLKSDDEVRRFYEELFQQMRGFERWIFAAACQTTVHTPWERIKLVIELCRQHGGRPA